MVIVATLQPFIVFCLGFRSLRTLVVVCNTFVYSYCKIPAADHSVSLLFVFILCFCVSEASHHFHLNDEIVLVCNNFFTSTVFVGSGVSQVIVHFIYKGKSPQPWHKRRCSVLLSAICMQNLIRIIPPAPEKMGIYYFYYLSSGLSVWPTVRPCISNEFSSQSCIFLATINRNCLKFKHFFCQVVRFFLFHF